MLEGISNDPVGELEFNLAQQQLFDLTSIVPQQSSQAIDIVETGEHLRFIFSSDMEASKLRVRLKYLKIDSIQNSFDEPQIAYSDSFFVKVLPTQFPKIQKYFLQDQLNIEALRECFDWLIPKEEENKEYENFDIPLKQLHLLTAKPPTKSNRTIRILSETEVVKGPHLRFTFSSEAKLNAFSSVLTELEILHTADLKRKMARSQFEYYITVDPTQFSQVAKQFYKKFGWLKFIFAKASEFNLYTPGYDIVKETLEYKAEVNEIPEPTENVDFLKERKSHIS